MPWVAALETKLATGINCVPSRNSRADPVASVEMVLVDLSHMLLRTATGGQLSLLDIVHDLEQRPNPSVLPARTIHFWQ